MAPTETRHDGATVRQTAESTTPRFQFDIESFTECEAFSTQLSDSLDRLLESIHELHEEAVKTAIMAGYDGVDIYSDPSLQYVSDLDGHWPGYSVDFWYEGETSEYPPQFHVSRYAIRESEFSRNELMDMVIDEGWDPRDLE